MNTLKQRYQKVKHDIEQLSQEFNRDTPPMLLAVSKKHPADMIRELYGYGQQSFGENYVQEAIDKMAHLNDLNIEWHFIGPIQSNKTKAIAENFAWVHSVDRLKIAQRLNSHLQEINKHLNICLQVNINREPQKAGFLREELLSHFGNLLEFEQLSIRGLMAIPQNTNDPIKQAENFNLLKKLKTKLNQQFNLTMDTLSMGMSGDIGPAIKEGSTMIRIGTAIFGARN